LGFSYKISATKHKLKIVLEHNKLFLNMQRGNEDNHNKLNCLDCPRGPQLMDRPTISPFSSVVADLALKGGTRWFCAQHFIHLALVTAHIRGIALGRTQLVLFF